MGLISASSLGQPILKVNCRNKNNRIPSESNVLSKRSFVISTTMAPALTTEISAEHRKHSLSNNFKLTPKLDSNSLLRRPSSQGGGNRDVLDDDVDDPMAATLAPLKQQQQSKLMPGPPTQSTASVPLATEENIAPTAVAPKTSAEAPTTAPMLPNSDEEAALKAAEEVLGHNVEDFLKVLESMEGKCGSSTTAGEESMLRLLGSDLELLGGMAQEMVEQEQLQQDRASSPASSSPSSKVMAEDKLAEASGRQHLLERRCERLLRRARKMQARGTARHTAHQMQDLVTSAKALLKARNASHRSQAASQQQAGKEQLLDTESVKNDGTSSMSASALVNLVRKISTAVPAPTQGLSQALSPDQATTIGAGARGLAFRLHRTETAFDSDVTASSSGGESCDEAAGFNPNNTGTMPICKRAAWRYARERASVVSRWTWLQANISDLEYRIRQYSECFRQLRASKGPVRLEEPIISKPQHQGSESMGMVVNGCHAETGVSLPETETACRVRPLDLRVFRKRKIVVPGVMMPKTSSTCPQHNQPPCCRDSTSMPCVLCFAKRIAPSGGNLPNRELGVKEGVKERAARLDPAVHHILSGSQDISCSLHMAAQLRQPTWQQNQLRQRSFSKLSLGIKKSKMAAVAAAAGFSGDALSGTPPRRKYTFHKKHNYAPTALSAKIRRKAKNRKRHRGRPPASEIIEPFERYKRTGRRVQRHSVASTSADLGGDSLESSDRAFGDAGTSSEIRAPRRRREDSYDIDNIVIPYSMAALTRVEKLEYKEILTPKWRIAEIPSLTCKTSLGSSKNGVVRSSSGPVPKGNNLDAEDDSNAVEDISDEAVLARHEILEMEERRKFRCPPSAARGFRGRRTDSRAESSGANTPDPMSPNPGPSTGDSPLASPRATPLPPALLPALLMEETAGIASSSKSSTLTPQQRRRTVSSQRTNSPEPSSSVPEVAPFEARVFPIPDDVYLRMRDVDGVRTTRQATAQQREEVVPEPPVEESAPPSPCGTDSTESAIPEDDDDMDPEWTVDSEMPSPPSSGAGSPAAPTRGSLRRSQ